MPTWQPSMSGALPFSGPNNQEDPLGIGAMQAAQAGRWDLMSQGLTAGGANPAFLSGPNFDPQWAAALQPLSDADRVRGGPNFPNAAMAGLQGVQMPQVQTLTTQMAMPQPAAWGSLSPGFSGSSLPQSAGGPAQAPPQAPQQGEQAMNGLKNANRKQSVGAPNPYDPNFGGQIKKPQAQPTNPQSFPSGSY